LLCSCPLWSNPYRFLLVIADEWSDPASHIIEGTSQFATVAALLKTWGLRFDILRLDQQRLDNYYLLDREGRPRYGTVIWLANPDALEGKDLERRDRFGTRRWTGSPRWDGTTSSAIAFESARFPRRRRSFT